MREAPEDPLRDLKAAARWKNGVSHTNWMCADLQRLVYSPDSETGGGREWESSQKCLTCILSFRVYMNEETAIWWLSGEF